MMDWQPIDTAPTDEFILLSDGDEVCEGCRGLLGLWWSTVDYMDDRYGKPMDPQPTYWQPRPNPPKIGDSQ